MRKVPFGGHAPTTGFGSNRNMYDRLRAFLFWIFLLAYPVRGDIFCGLCAGEGILGVTGLPLDLTLAPSAVDVTK